GLAGGPAIARPRGFGLRRIPAKTRGHRQPIGTRLPLVGGTHSEAPPASTDSESGGSNFTQEFGNGPAAIEAIQSRPGRVCPRAEERNAYRCSTWSSGGLHRIGRRWRLGPISCSGATSHARP